MKRALISVSDKTGIVELAKELTAMGIAILSTGGTAKELEAAGIKVIGISEITHFPECLDGRVKTLHPSIHGGLLARRDLPGHMQQLEDLKIEPIDIVIVNLYPFKATIEKEGTTLEEAIENIDIGGPSMLRSAAKNNDGVVVVCDPDDYNQLVDELKAGAISKATKFEFAVKAFEHTAAYDSLIAAYLRKQAGTEPFPKQLTWTFERAQTMRYGENPHQNASFYKEAIAGKGTVALAKQLHGKELSYNNINDTNGALELLKEYEEPTIVAVKHANPCGVGSDKDIYGAYMKAYNADTVSIFGGIVASNREIDEKTATQIHNIFIEIVIAPSFTKKALSILTAKKNIRLLTLEDIAHPRGAGGFDMKRVGGGLLIQEPDDILYHEADLKVVSSRKPTDQEMADLIFTWKIVKHVKSNGIAIGKDKQSVGIGPGQVNRIWACNQAIEHGVAHLGAEAVRGAALASDAYFPFPDSVEAAARAGVTAVIHPGGSKNDQLSIDVCNANNMAMVLTDMRHFKH